MNFRNISIRSKFLILIFFCCTTVLLLSLIAFAFNDVSLFRQAEAHKNEILAKVIGQSSKSALVFSDPKVARENLNSLIVEPQVSAACIYDKEGKIFATFQRDPSSKGEFPGVSADAHYFKDEQLHTFKEIYLDQSRVGTIYIRTSMERLQTVLIGRVQMGFFILLFAIALAFLMSISMGHFISAPIIALTDLMRNVSREKNFSVRAKKRGSDEVGVLVDGFNDMLTEIQNRDEALKESRVDLENRVKERTRELTTEIVERKLIEQELRDKARELSRSNADLKQFAYVASHDLQEPLRMVSSYTSLLSKNYKGKLSNEADEFIHFAIKGVTHMHQLINDLLSYSQIGSKIKTCKVNCNEVMERVLAQFERSLAETQVRITYGTLPTIDADPTQLFQLLQNLLSNALKFRGTNNPQIHVGCKLEQGEYIFSFQDNGIGIEPQYFERIFIIFQRLHSLADFPGTGIGLAICKKIIDHHGGRIWVESEVGKGSTFYFTIPLIPAHERSGSEIEFSQGSRRF
jgi:signal transduction histidine kinase